MATRLVCFIIGMTSLSCVLAQEQMEAGVLMKLARDTNKPTKAILVGPAAGYLHQTFQTQATIYAEAFVVKTIDDRCSRLRIIITIPDLVITVRNPANPEQQKTGAFETTTELNLCN